MNFSGLLSLLIIIGSSFNAFCIGRHWPCLHLSGILDVVHTMTVWYSYAQLTALCPHSLPSPPPQPVCDRLRLFGLWQPCRLLGHRLVPRRGVRAGRSRRRSSSQQQQQQCFQSRSSSPSSAASASVLSLGFLNICSIGKKLDDLLDVRRDRSIDIICLAETWHDDDCVAFRRLRAAGYQVIDRARPRPSAAADTTTNHGGVAIVAVPGVSLSTVTAVSDTPTTFEFVCIRVTVGQFAAIITVIYRPGSSAVSSLFFHELSYVLDAVAAFQDPIYIVGDFNIRLERGGDSNTRQFVDLLASYGLSVLPTGTTHRDGGTLDAVVVRHDMLDVHNMSGGPCASVVDIGLSDHHLLTWSAPARRPQPPTESVLRRSWRSLNVDDLRDELRASPLCQPDSWPDDIDDMAASYDAVLTSILDKLVPVRRIVRRPRPSDPWFDQECRDAKRLTRRLERAYSAACRRLTSGSTAAAAAVAAADTAKAAWYAQRRRYRELRDAKRSAFWCTTIEADRASPRRLWRSVDMLLGRGRLPVSSAITVDDLNKFFTDKVAAIRAGTADAPDPLFTATRSGVSLSSFSVIPVSDVVTGIMKLPDKSSAADPLPVPVLKQVATDIAPFLTELFNRSLAVGHFPLVFKEAFVTPVLKKHCLGTAKASSYSQISNLPVISKLLERFVTKQLITVSRFAAVAPVWFQAWPLHGNRCPAGAFRHSRGRRQC